MKGYSQRSKIWGENTDGNGYRKIQRAFFGFWRNVFSIPFKAKAWLDLKKRKENGESIDRKNVLKHKRDVFRLSQLITENDSVNLPAEIKKDMSEFISGMENDDIDPKSFGINAAKDEILYALRKVYKI